MVMLASLLSVVSFILAVGAQGDGSADPPAIDPGCQSFLNALNTDTKFYQCLTSITTATAAFNSTDSTATQADVESALNNMCQSTACDRENVLSLLLQFAQSCRDDLVTTQDVSSVYDMVYNTLPIRSALCQKDGGQYCALHKDVVGSSNGLQMPEGDLAEIVMANLDAIGSSNLPFLFLNPNSPPTALCSVCTQNILSNLVNLEDQVPYAIGVGQSPLLQGQLNLWHAVAQGCGAEVATNIAVTGGTSEVDGGEEKEEKNAASVRAASSFVAILAAGLLAFAL